MNAPRIRALIALVLMAAAFAGAQAWRPSAHLADTRPAVELETLFPKGFGEWVVDERMPVQLISPDVQELLDKTYNQTLSRTYVSTSGERVMLSVAYGGDQSDGTRAHRPEVCYPAQGFEILDNQRRLIKVAGRDINVRTLLSRLGQRWEPITYWVVVGDEIATSGFEQRLAEIRYGMRGIISDGILVRVSTIDSDAERGLRVQQTFIADMASVMPEPALRSVFGSKASL